MAKTRWVRPADILVALLCAAAAIALFLVPLFGKDGGSVCIVSESGETRLSLSKDTVHTVTGKDGLTVTVTVQNGTVRVTHADCPDQVCVSAGMLSKAGQSAVCVPAAVAVMIEGAADGTVPDAVVR